MEVLLGIDIGTSSTKGVLVTPGGAIVAERHRDHRMSMPRPGWMEVDAEQVWWREVTDISQSLVRSAPGPVRGVCISGIGPSLVLCDGKLQPLRPAILYGIDTRTTDEIELLNERYTTEAILANCGKRLTTQAMGPKLEWVRRHEPATWGSARGWYTTQSYIAAKLTGEYVIDHHTASQSDPLYVVPEFDWHPEWAPEISGHLGLPRLAWPHEVVGTVHSEAAAATGLPAGTPVVAGTIDALSEAFSVGVRKPGDLMIMYGSTMFCAQVLDGYHVSPHVWTTAGVAPGTHTLTGGTATAGSLTAWLKDLTGGADFGTLADEAAQVPRGSEGLLVLPHFAGERTPIFDPGARGVIAGLTLRHSRAHLFRAVYEGIAFGARSILEHFQASPTPIRRIVAVGGGLRSPLWSSILTDVIGQQQLLPQCTIGASYGGALLAAIGSGTVAPDVDWTVMEGSIEPDPEGHAFYDELYAIWSELRPATRSQVNRLTELAAGDGAGPRLGQGFPPPCRDRSRAG
jgi:xylulokinase